MTRKLELHKHAVELCEILGQDPNHVHEITINVRPHKPLEIIVTLYPLDTELRQIMELMKRVSVEYES